MNMRFVLVALLLLIEPVAAPAAAPCTAVAAIVARYDAYKKAEAGGDAGLLLPDVTPAGDRKRAKELQGFRDQLSAVPHAAMSPEDALDTDLLVYAIDEQLGAIRFDEARLAFNSDGGFDVDLLYAADRASLRNGEDLAAWLRLIDSVPAYYDASIANARRGITTGFVQPRITVEQVLGRARTAAAVPLDDDALLAPIRRAVGIAPADRQAALASARSVIEARVEPARRAFVTFLQEEYLPHARTALAVTTLPDGKAYYAWLVRRYTTTDMSPEQIHAVGLAEVARIRAEMDAVMREAGFHGDLKAFLAFLRTDPQFYVATREQLLEKGSEIAKRIDAQLPAHFATLPRLTYGVRAVPREIEEGYTTGRYFQGDPERGIAGGLMLNTSHLDQRPLYELPALELHEGVPGHHLQIALGQEAAMPEFRRNSYYSGFGEGWGLYSEWLGEEMGIYRTPYERFGRLSYEMWRACRLVADTGIHLKGWSFKQARACFADNTALSDLNIDIEVQRYVSWPGQALAYKVGEMEFRKLRTEAEQRLGSRFDERRFHDALLLAGSMPLTILEGRIDRWIAAQLQANAPPASGEEAVQPVGSPCRDVEHDRKVAQAVAAAGI
jgi:uncharacterized protein (DUF885 family)